MHPRYLFTVFLVVQAIAFVIAYAFMIPKTFVLEAAASSLLAALPMYFAESLVPRRE